MAGEGGNGEKPAGTNRMKKRNELCDYGKSDGDAGFREQPSSPVG
jgi:hypothetical protein